MVSSYPIPTDNLLSNYIVVYIVMNFIHFIVYAALFQLILRAFPNKCMNAHSNMYSIIIRKCTMGWLDAMEELHSDLQRGTNKSVDVKIGTI